MHPRVKDLKARLDTLIDNAEYHADPSDLPVLREAVANFKLAGPELLDEATEPLFAYYRTIHDCFSAEERAEYDFPKIARPEDVWDHVEFNHPPHLDTGDGEYSPARSYIDFEGGVSWEIEHGLELVIEEGVRVCRVGPYDGHLTNAHAFAALSLLGVIYRG
ncbi:MAG: hypothetical protein R3B07_34350 [Polyangiaceae bacterium]